MYKIYSGRLIIRLILFVIIATIYVIEPAILSGFVDFRLMGDFSWWHILWLFYVIWMLLHLFPAKTITLGAHKKFGKYYKKPKNFDRQKLKPLIKKAQLRAGSIMVVWLIIHAVFFILYKMQILGIAELFLLAALYLFADFICIIVFCPFQVWGMKCNCCMDCRIFEWDHFFMHSPLILIPCFYSVSLFMLAMIVFLSWEISFYKYPERFFRQTNQALRCGECTDKLCTFKKSLAKSGLGKSWLNKGD